jgi:hypothetical protein
LTIKGGDFNVGSTYGAAIGSGYATHGSSNINTLLITGGHITARSYSHGAGIGAGASTMTGHSGIRELRIRGVTDLVAFGSGGSGIGSGTALGGQSIVEQLVLESGSYRLYGQKFGSGIGSGEVAAGTDAVSRVVNLEIWNGTFVTVGYVGIGETPIGTVGTLRLSHGAGSKVDIRCAAERPFCLGATSLILDAGTVYVETNTSNIVDPATSHSVMFQQGHFIGSYASRSNKESIYGTPMIHLTDLTLPPGWYNLLVKPSYGQSFNVVIDSATFKGLLVTVPGAGTYEIEVKTLIGDVSEGRLCHRHDLKGQFSVGNDEAVFDLVMLCSEEAKLERGLTSGAKAGISIAVIVVVAAVAVFCVWRFVLRKPDGGDGAYVSADSPKEKAPEAYTP